MAEPLQTSDGASEVESRESHVDPGVPAVQVESKVEGDDSTGLTNKAEEDDDVSPSGEAKELPAESKDDSPGATNVPETKTSEPETHHNPNLTSTVTVEEDAQPSMFQKLRGRFQLAEDKAKGKGSGDPHPELTGVAPAPAAQPGLLTKVKKVFVKGGAVGSGAEEDSGSLPGQKEEGRKGDGTLEPTEVSGQPAVEPANKTVDNTELGTGYQADSEGSVGQVPKASHQIDEKTPVATQEGGDSTSRDINVNSDVKAPGMGERAKEEVEAIAKDFHEKTDLKDKSTDDKPPHGGFLGRFAKKFLSRSDTV